VQVPLVQAAQLPRQRALLLLSVQKRVRAPLQQAV